MKPMYIKLAMAAGLFLAWVLLVAFQVQGAGDLIEFIKTALQGIGLYHAVQWGNEQSTAVLAVPAPAVPQHLPASPVAPGSETAAAGTALAPSPVLQ